LRNFNFHEGQWQAILNTIYVHEILKAKNVHDLYMSILPELLAEMDLLDLKKDKYNHPMYCIKMATGTGKTWVLSALLIWQYLNSKHEESSSRLFTKNFLLVAPGIIVYERLLPEFALICVHYAVCLCRRILGFSPVFLKGLQAFQKRFLSDYSLCTPYTQLTMYQAHRRR